MAYYDSKADLEYVSASKTHFVRLISFKGLFYD